MSVRVSLAVAPFLLALLPMEPVVSAPAAPPRPPANAVLGTYVRAPDKLSAGTEAALRIATHWATSETASGPWPGVDVEVTLKGHGHEKLVYRGRTDGGGVADARFDVPAWPDGSYTVEVASRAGERRERHTHEIALAPGARLLLESDKPLYQPAQVIHLRAVGLRPQDGKPLAGRSVTLTVADPRGNHVFRESRVLSEFGVAAADFTLADEIMLGSYRARVELSDGGASGSASSAELELPVSRYSLPKLKVSVEPDRAWYRPGDTVKLAIEGRYFFGKPVAGGQATIHARLQAGGPTAVLPVLHAKLDGEGRARLELALPRSIEGDEARLRLSTEIVDAADQRASADRETLVSASDVRIELTPEGRALVPGAPNRVWVAVTDPEGTPLPGTAVELATADGVQRDARTDAIGVAEFSVDARAAGVGCPSGQVRLAATLRREGVRRTVDRCVPADPYALAVRTDRAIYPAGAPMTFDVFAPDGLVYLDVVKDGQTIATTQVMTRLGRGQVTLPPDARRFGSLAIDAYRVAPDGQQRHESRLIYVERAGSLKVDVHPEQASFRPGAEGRIRVHVADAVSGEPARAQLGVVMVDQSLLALRAMRPGAARVYFTLAAEASKPQLAMKARPGGYTVERLIEEGSLDELKQEAARVLLAGAVPPWQPSWEIDPWQLRRDARDQQSQHLTEALQKWAATHPVGERAGKTWRFRRDLLNVMVEGGGLAARDLRDPWGRRVPIADTLSSAGLDDFPSWAAEETRQRLTQIYAALARDSAQLQREPAAKGHGFVITQADLARLASSGRLPAGRLVDPWGVPFRLDERPRPIAIVGVLSRFVVASAGPDGLVASKDDVSALEFWTRTSRRNYPMAEMMEVRGGLGGWGGGGRGEAVLAPMAFKAADDGGPVHHATGARPTGASSASGGAEPERVRQDFPETMLWQPELTTDARGDAIIDARMADSITTWQLTAEAIAADGRMGQSAAEVRVFQDFFVDLDLPPVVTQHDELAVPVAVYNYLPSAQQVTLTLDDGAWFERTGDATQTLDLGPSKVDVRYFKIRVAGVGRRTLTVHARGAQASDAIKKPIEVIPDGRERALSFQDSLGAGAAHHELVIPDNAIADASLATLKVYPAMATHVIEGLDSMLRMPGGCFEQTSSTTYPNALILDYLKHSKQSTAAVEKKAHEYLSAGYQRLLSFEVKGGGFSWFGQAPANKILTAYGLEEFHDMARVHPIDRRVITRTQAWLAQQQKPDGSWAPDTYFINEGATNHFNKDVVRITAYIAVALAHTGAEGPAIEKARGYVRRALASETVRDPYTLALVAELLSGTNEHSMLEAVLERLWQERTEQKDGKTVAFTAKEKTPTYGDGKSGTVETTALAAFAMLQAPSGGAGRVDRAVGYLLGAKDTFGNWYSTQATILSLKALLAYGSRQTGGKGTITVTVDGNPVASLPVDAKSEALESLDLGAAARPGAHRVDVRYEGTGQIAYQLVGRWFEPRETAHAEATADAEAGGLTTTTTVDHARVQPGGVLVEEVRAESKASVDMPIVTAGLPPGFDVDGEELEALVRARVVEKVQRTPRELVFYLTRLEPGRALDVKLHLRARFPERVQLPAPTAYEYYRPEHRVAGAPLTITVESSSG